MDIEMRGDLSLTHRGVRWVRVIVDGDNIGFGPEMDTRTGKGVWIAYHGSNAIIVANGRFQYALSVNNWHQTKKLVLILKELCRVKKSCR